MKSQPQNPEFRINPEIVQPRKCGQRRSAISLCPINSTSDTKSNYCMHIPKCSFEQIKCNIMSHKGDFVQ